MRSSYDLKKLNMARDPVTLPLLFVSEGYVRHLYHIRCINCEL